MSTRKDARILIIAGPNGAGKTTFAEEFLPNEADCPIFVNADLIAAGIAPLTPTGWLSGLVGLCWVKSMSMSEGERALPLKPR
jgi:chloramphenicol 3-O-phosphotransferase